MTGSATAPTAALPESAPSAEALRADASGVPLEEQPHHDSGPSFVPVPPAGLGEEVLLRLWVPAAYPATGVALRTVVDGEIRTATVEKVREDPSGSWWETSLRAVNPVMVYRFCILAEEGALTASGAPVPAYAWLTAAGLLPWDVADATDFRLVAHEPAPAWVDDAVVYHVFPDRFARGADVPVDDEGRPAPEDLPEWAVPMAWDEEPAVRGIITGRQYYGGDLDGVIEHLDHIASLGANTVYLTPIFPAGSVHRYDASTFDRVDPLLGGDEALVRLSAALHERGMRLILDLTTNHTGDTHEWFRIAQADASSTEAGFYLFEEHPDRYAAWLEVPSLPKLDHRSEELRERLTRGPGSVVGHYLAEPFSADGWRIDVANMTGRHGEVDLAHDVAREIRATMREARGAVGGESGQGREHWLVAEHGHDATGDLDGDGWHGTMNYTGFTRPLWSWLAAPDSALNWLGLPMTLPRISGTSVAHTLREYNAHMPWPSRAHSQNQLSSHDTARIRTVVGDRDRQLAALAALATLPGVPTLFAGDELGAEGETGEHSRTPMPWGAIADEDGSRIDVEVLRETRAMLGLRGSEVALRRGGMRWLRITPDALVYVRTHPEGDVLVHLARAAHGVLDLDLSALPDVGSLRLLHELGGAETCIDGNRLRLAADAAGASAVRVQRPAASTGS
ncbi:glycoside hydrolase family 13 protein [Brachybacterium sp. DNPG3]